MDGHDVVIHLASNPDIARAATEPDIDFWQGTALTHNVVEAMRTTSAKRILYASGSGVYGDLGTVEADRGSRPAAAGLDLRREQARGRGADLAATRSCSGSRAAPSASATSSARARPTASASTSRAACSPTRRALRILGDGSQSKSYIHVTDVVRAVLAAHAATAAAVPRLQRRDRRLHHRHRDRRRWPSSASACARRACASTSPAATAAGRATCPIVRLDTRAHPEHRLALPPVDARGAAPVDAGDDPRHEREGRM